MYCALLKYCIYIFSSWFKRDIHNQVACIRPKKPIAIKGEDTKQHSLIVIVESFTFREVSNSIGRAFY